jgi:Gpi18-like mannosyltransferase
MFKLSSPKALSKNEILFVLAMWLLSRLVIIVAMQWVAPLIFTDPVHPEWESDSSPNGFIPGYIPRAGWEVFSHWDGKWYSSIANGGYEYVKDGLQHSVAFFPLFPLLIHLAMGVGLPFEVAGLLINNLAFLGALVVLYLWVKESQDDRVARWAVLVLAWCPASLFGTVIYTEGLFLLVSTQSLRSFDQHLYGWAAFWGFLASATRVPGMALMPAFLFIAWRERRPLIAYITALVTTGGLISYCVYTTVQFDDPLAFFHARAGWNNPTWLDSIKGALTLDQPSLLSLAALLVSFILLWYLRLELPPVATVYGLLVLVLLLTAGPASFYRYLYGTVSLSFGLGILLSRHFRVGYGVIGFFAVSLFAEALHFASWDWIRWD